MLQMNGGVEYTEETTPTDFSTEQINVSHQHSQNITYGLNGDGMGCVKQEDNEETQNKKMNKLMNVMTMSIISKMLEKL